MPFGFSNSTTISMDNITYIANSTNFLEMTVKANETMFGGVGFFILLCVLWAIFFLIFQQTNEDEFFINVMVASTVVMIASFFIRAIEIIVHGVTKGLMTDKLLWIFPLLAIFSATILYLTKKYG